VRAFTTHFWIDSKLKSTNATIHKPCQIGLRGFVWESF